MCPRWNESRDWFIDTETILELYSVNSMCDEDLGQIFFCLIVQILELVLETRNEWMSGTS